MRQHDDTIAMRGLHIKGIHVCMWRSIPRRDVEIHCLQMVEKPYFRVSDNDSLLLSNSIVLKKVEGESRKNIEFWV